MADRSVREFTTQAPAGYIGDFLQSGIFPYAQRFLHGQFANMGAPDSSPYTYTGPRVAGFDPRERMGMNLADQAIGSYQPYLGRQAGLLDAATAFTTGGLGRGETEITRGLRGGRGLTREATGLTRDARFTQPGLGDFRGAMPDFTEAQQLTRAGAPNLDLARLETAGARPDFRGARSGIARSAAEVAGARPDYGGARGGLGRAELSGYGSTRGFDPSGISRFYNPFEEDVVQQTLKDVREGLAKGDMGLRDEAVSAGAFGGSRSRMRRDELAENVARGAAEQIGAIRSGGYQDAANRAQQAFEAQQARLAGLGSLQAQLSGMEGGFAGQEAQTALGRASQLGSLAGQEGGFAGQEGAAALARGRQFGDLSTTEAQNALTRAAQLGSLEAQQAQAKLARGEALNQSEQMAVNNAMQRGQQLGGFGQQQFGMGLQGGQGLASLGYQGAAGLGNIGQQYGSMAPSLQNLQTTDINRQMQLGGLGRGRQQSLMDLGYQNFVGQYNLPMQTLQNVGALTASLGPMAGGYGYAGQGMPTEFAGGGVYQPAGGGIPAPGAGSYTPYSTGTSTGNYQPYTPSTPTPGPGVGPGPGIGPIYNQGQPQSNIGGGAQTQTLNPVSPTNYNTYGNNMPVGFRYGGGIRSLKYNG